MPLEKGSVLIRHLIGGIKRYTSLNWLAGFTLHRFLIINQPISLILSFTFKSNGKRLLVAFNRDWRQQDPLFRTLVDDDCEYEGRGEEEEEGGREGG